MNSNICVHIDTLNNTVLTRGIYASDFFAAITHQPKNLLLLDTATTMGEFESHTGMKMIKGTEAVINYGQQWQRRGPSSQNKWIDFNDVTMLKELTPIEISELLYLGHTQHPLRSPFFYKMQNNFVYFDGSGYFSKTYYRYLDEFFQVLAKKITTILQPRVNERRSIFRRSSAVEPIPTSQLKTLKHLFQEGISFSFDKAEYTNQLFKIPIYVVEDRFWKSQSAQASEQLAASITYNANEKNWQIAIENDDLNYLINQNAN